MSDFESHSAGREARRAVPGSPWRPDEEHRQEMLRRYLHAVAAVAHTDEQPPAAARHEAPPHEREPAHEPAVLRVRDVMTVPAASIGGETPFLDIARTLSREHLSAIPVVDADDRVIGVVSESDLLAKAAVEAAPHRQGRVGRLREHRLYEKSRGETAATLMTSPAVTVYPGTTVAEAAWLAARSRVKRLPVADHRGRLVGVVSRGVLLRALVRDDAEIRADIESRIMRRDLGLDPASLDLRVENGVVILRGKLDHEVVPKLVAEIRETDDVVDVDDHLIRV